MSEWQPIETAPVGVLVLICHMEDGIVYVAKQYPNELGVWIDQDGLDFDYGTWTPTHWMHRPPD